MTFILATLTGIGVGSGGLYILYLTLIKDIPQSTAQGMNLAFFITAMLSAGIVNFIKKRLSGTILAIILPGGIIGAVIGCKLASEINSRTLSVLFGILLCIIGVSGFAKLIKKKN